MNCEAEYVIVRAENTKTYENTPSEIETLNDRKSSVGGLYLLKARLQPPNGDKINRSQLNVCSFLHLISNAILCFDLTQF